MPKQTSGPHTLESVEHVALRLEKIAADIRVSYADMARTPPIKELEIVAETSLQNGLIGMQAWADALRDAVSAARLGVLRNGVSEQPHGSDKRRKKK